MISINKKSIVAFGLATLTLFSSCTKDLDRKPTNLTTAERIFNDPIKTKQFLAKVYGSYALESGDVEATDNGSTGFLRGYFNLQELPTEEAICAWNDGDIKDLHNMTWTSSNGFIKILYYRSLYQIKLATSFIQKSEAKKDEPTIKGYRAEARFLRAFQYWLLMDLFGNPPMINEELGVGKVYPKQFKRAELFAYIEKELKEIEMLLPEPKANEYGRADRAAVWALLSRLYLNAEVYTGTEQYAKSAEYAEKVIGAGYSLAPKYEHLFLADNDQNNPEVIMSINYDVKGQNYGGTNFIIHASCSDKSKELLAKEKQLNMGVSGGWGGYRATKNFMEKFEVKDKRNFTLSAQPEISNVGDFNQGVYIYKYRNVLTDGAKAKSPDMADNDFPLFRLGEMYLNYAEAAVRGKADEAKGLAYINQLRKRAEVKEWTKADLSLDNLLEERGRELYWECLRRVDLIRFAKFVSNDSLWAWKGGVKSGQGVAEHFKLYPIPSEDILANPNLKQNTGY